MQLLIHASRGQKRECKTADSTIPDVIPFPSQILTGSEVYGGLILPASSSSQFIPMKNGWCRKFENEHVGSGKVETYI